MSSTATEALALRSIPPADRPTVEVEPTMMPTPSPSAAPAAKPAVAFAPPGVTRKQEDGASAAISAQTLLKRGDELFARGDLSGARLFYKRAASSGSAQAALALGKTLDPVVHEQLHVRGLSPDPDEAARWYREAVASGVGEAEGLLKDLNGWIAAHRK